MHYCGGRVGLGESAGVGLPPSLPPLLVSLPVSFTWAAHSSMLRGLLLHPTTPRRLCSGLLCTGAAAALVRLQVAQMERIEAEAEAREGDGGGARPEGAAEEEVGGCLGWKGVEAWGKGECQRWLQQGG